MANRGKKSAVYGELTTSRGQVMPVEVMPPGAFSDKAGYAPQALDPIIEKLLENAASGAELLTTTVPMLRALMVRLQAEVAVLLSNMPVTQPLDPNAEVVPPDMGGAISIVLGLADKASMILDRLQKMNLNQTKAADDATRLRTFLATGDEENDGLKGLGEAQLARMVTDAASGWQKREEA